MLCLYKAGRKGICNEKCRFQIPSQSIAAFSHYSSGDAPGYLLVRHLSFLPCDDSLKTVFVVNGACLHQRGKCVPYRRILYGTHVSYILPFAFVRARISTYKGTPAQQKMPQNFGWMEVGGGNLVLIVMDGTYMVINRWPQKKKKSFQIQRSRRLFYFFNLCPL